MKLTLQKLEGWGFLMLKIHNRNRNFNRYD